MNPAKEARVRFGHNGLTKQSFTILPGRDAALRRPRPYTGRNLCPVVEIEIATAAIESFNLGI
jgi:hypothetical protein